MADVRYLTTTLGEAPILAATDPSRVQIAETYVSRSGAIVDKCSDYYVGVFRLSFNADASIPLWIPRLTVPSVDGITLENSVTLRATIGGVTYRGRAFLQLQIPLADRILWQTQPTTVYAFVWDIALFCSILNDALARAYAALITAGAPLIATEAPFVSFQGGTGLMTMTAYPHSRWAEPYIGADRVEMFFNRSSLSTLDGWLLYLYTDPTSNDPPDANGEDIKLRLVNDGLNYDPKPVGGYAGPQPAAPATASISMVQSNRTVFPSIGSVRLISTLPCAAEFIPGRGSATTSQILTDFAPDPTSLSESYVYNASFGDARWIKLTGAQPLTQFTLKLETVDWQGAVRPLELVGQGTSAEVKLCFAPRRMVETVTL